MWTTPPEYHDLDDEEHFTAHHLVRYIMETAGTAIGDHRVSDVVVGTFLPRTVRNLVSLVGATPKDPWVMGSENTQIFHGATAGRPVTVVKFPVGAPATASVMEVLIACGARHFLILGAAGSLQDHAPIGALTIPDSVVREDGTSFHYLPASAMPRPSPALVAMLVERCRARDVEPLLGLNWSTDAMFREFKKKVVHFRERGVLTVEMEAAAVFAIAQLRGVEAALLLTISDELFRPWEPAFLHQTYRTRLRIAQEVLLDVAARLPLPANED